MSKDYVCGLFEGHVWSSGGALFDRFITVLGKDKTGTIKGVLSCGV